MSVDIQLSVHPCAQCARMQQTCCQRAEIVVTQGDVARIERHTGRSDFWERRAPADPAYLAEDADDPGWKPATVAPDGTRRVLRRHSNGDCGFLGPAGCVLPLDIRPLVCRLYPWSFTHVGLTGEAAEYCPVETFAPHGGSMLTVLNMKHSEAEQWRAMLYRELHADQEHR